MSNGLIRAHQSSFSTLYRFIDILVIAAILRITCLILDRPYTEVYLLQTVTAIALFLLLSESLELYRSWRTESFFQQMSVTVICWGLVCSTFAFIMYFTMVFDGGWRKVPFIWMVATTFALPLWRYILRQFLTSIRAKGSNTRSAIIIGATKSGVELANNITSNTHLGINLLGFCDDRGFKRLNEEHLENQEYELIGNVSFAIKLAQEDKIDNIYIAMPMSAEKRIQEILALCGNTTATVHIIPDFFTYNLINSRLSKVGNMQTLSVYDTPINGLSSWAKRMEDLVLASAILTIIALPMLVIAAIIKLTSKGPVFFKQDRYGLDGQKIKVWKFRSMTSCDNGSTVVQAKKNDSRITPFGAFIRKTSLDELPQFFNVLKGNMSVVGPRPHAVAHNEEYREQIGCYMLRHKVKPGITGWAQINGWRGETDTLGKMESRIEFDLEYMRRWSVFFDLKIVFLTIFKGFTGNNVY